MDVELKWEMCKVVVNGDRAETESSGDMMDLRVWIENKVEVMQVSRKKQTACLFCG